MSEMVERVADDLILRFKARIAAHAGRPFNELDVNVPERAIWLDYARAAIEAMREPTEEMVDALVRDMRSNELCWDANDEVMRRVINKIIDEALK